MKHATVYILTGLPFAGKTSLAKKLIHRFGFVSVAIDDINTEFGVGLHNTPITQKEWDRTYNESYKRVKQLLKEGKQVIYDATNYTKEQRDTIKQIAINVSCDAQVVYINTPKDEVRRRWIANKNTQVRPDVREENFAEVINNFVPPKEDEKPIVYTNDMSIDEWVNIHGI